VFSLQALLPQGLRLVDVQGENINNWQVDPKDNTLRVDLRSKAESAYELKLEAEADVKTPQGVELPAVTLVGAERERGFITVSAVPGMRVDVGKVEASARLT